MPTLYISAANNTTGGAALDAGGGDVEVFRLVVGAPVVNGNIWIYDENNVGNTSNTTGIKAKLTLPGTLATGQLPFAIDLTDNAGHGLRLGMGGSVAIDQTLQLTVLWDFARQPQVA